MIMAGSVEEKMYEKQVFKDGLRIITESGNTKFRYFSQEETTELFKLSAVGKSDVMEKLWSLGGESITSSPDDHGESIAGVMGYTRHDKLYDETKERGHAKAAVNTVEREAAEIIDLTSCDNIIDCQELSAHEQDLNIDSKSVVVLNDDEELDDPVEPEQDSSPTCQAEEFVQDSSTDDDVQDLVDGLQNVTILDTTTNVTFSSQSPSQPVVHVPRTARKQRNFILIESSDDGSSCDSPSDAEDQSIKQSTDLSEHEGGSSPPMIDTIAAELDQSLSSNRIAMLTCERRLDMLDEDERYAYQSALTLAREAESCGDNNLAVKKFIEAIEICDEDIKLHEKLAKFHRACCNDTGMNITP
jgi:hypothetical protein